MNLKLCPCGATPTTSSDIDYSVVWCQTCHKTLTREYLNPELAIIAWNLGDEHIPAPCPFCVVGSAFPVEIEKADSEDPIVFCRWIECPLEKKKFPLSKWNQCKPKAEAFQELLKRWNSHKNRYYFRSQILSLKRAIATHLHGGRYERSRSQKINL
jgi:hypothetical protein